MLITDQFVMLHNPKTGSTFARNVVMDLHASRVAAGSAYRRMLRRIGIRTLPASVKELILPHARVTAVPKKPNPHGTFAQIPDEYRDRKVVSIVRNPYSWLLSSYEFGWWKQHPNVPLPMLRQHIPSFPNLSLDDYVKLCELDAACRVGKDLASTAAGLETIQFIQMFFKHPPAVLAGLTQSYIDSSQVFDDIADIYFLRQEHLNEDLALFLAQHGFSAEEADSIRHRPRANVTPSGITDRSRLWTPTARAYVRDRERLIFRILKSKGIHYELDQCQ